MSSHGNQEYIRGMNSHLVLREIINNAPISRAEISKNLELTKATVSSIVQNFIANSLVLETGIFDTRIGRKPIMLQFNAACAYTIALNIDDVKISIMLTNMLGKPIFSEHYLLDVDRKQIVSKLIDIISITMQQAPPSTYGVVGISVGIHGIAKDNKIIYTGYFDLSNLNLAHTLQEHFGIPVYIENEANLSALGERVFCYDYDNLAHFSIHAALDVGLIIDGKLYSGNSGIAGQFGHTIIVPDGLPCHCGNKGCIEQYASELAVLTYYRTITHNPKAIPPELIAAYFRNEAPALESIQRFVTYISYAVNNIITTFDPDIVTINCIYTRLIPHLVDLIQNRLSCNVYHKRHVVVSKLDDSSILLGGAYVCIKNFLQLDNLKLH